jgi:thiol-disulfide isomerase/thioredoxin
VTVWIVGVSCAVAALSACSAATPSNEQAARDAAVAVPESRRDDPVALNGPSLDGRSLSLESSRGNVVVLNVWQSTCGPCRKEAPELVAAHQALSGRGVRFYGLDVNEANKDAATGYERKFGIAYPSFVDDGGRSLLALRGAVAPNVVPTTVILDRQGRIAVRFTGPVTQTTLTDAVEELLTEDSSSP